MPTILPPRQHRPDPQPEENRRDGDLMVPVLIICALLFANGALFCEKFYPPLPGYSLASSPAEIQLSP